MAAALALGVLSAVPAAPGLAAKRGPDLGPVAQRLVPHRAVYKMTLESARSGGGVTGAQGLMIYNFTETCDAWTAETNVFLKLRYAEGPESSSTWSFAAFEAKDGRQLRFRLRHQRDGATIEALRGSATLAADGSGGKAVFRGAGDGGADKAMALPAGTLFPTAHMVRVMAAAEKGKRFLPETVFDGASLDNPYRISASIGAARASASASAQAAATGLKAVLDTAGLKADPVWPVRLAFFPVASRKPEPDFEIGVDYRADGIAEKVLQDYGDFVIEMRPAEIEVLERPKC